MNYRRLRRRVLEWLIRLTSPFYPSVEVVRVRARPDFSAKVSRWTADEFGAREGSRDAFLVLLPRRTD